MAMLEVKDLEVRVYHLHFFKRNKKSMLINQCKDEQGRHHISYPVHPFQQSLYVRFY